MKSSVLTCVQCHRIELSRDMIDVEEPWCPECAGTLQEQEPPYQTWLVPDFEPLVASYPAPHQFNEAMEPLDNEVPF